MTASQTLTDALPPSPPQVLADRGIVQVAGADAQKFLNALLTNAVPPPDAEAMVFAGLLSPQGKLQFEFLLHAGAGAYRLDLARDRTAELIKRLTLYRLRADVVLTDRSAELAVVVGDGGLPDPRHPGLPPRALRAAVPNIPHPNPSPEGEGLERSKPLPFRGGVGVGDVRDSGYHARRIALGVPEGGYDYGWNEVFLHEALYDRVNGVDFAKGCYVGQEIVSRMQHRGTARSRFLPVMSAALLPPKGTEVRAGEALLGALGSNSGAHGLALLRLDRLREALASGTVLTAADVELTVPQASLAAFSGAIA